LDFKNFFYKIIKNQCYGSSAAVDGLAAVARVAAVNRLGEEALPPFLQVLNTQRSGFKTGRQDEFVKK
jgi:hypothetical protein